MGLPSLHGGLEVYYSSKALKSFVYGVIIVRSFSRSLVSTIFLLVVRGSRPYPLRSRGYAKRGSASWRQNEKFCDFEKVANSKIILKIYNS